MRSKRPVAWLFLALVYLATGLAASWHAPHFSTARAVLDVDHHRQHEAAFGDECALCSVKTSPQNSSAPAAHWLAVTRFQATTTPRIEVTETIRLRIALPRGPPFPLS